MLEELISLDKNLFIYLNNLGSTPFDTFWLLITNQRNWIPFFLCIAYILYKKTTLKQFVFTLVCIGLMIAFSDQMTNLVKNNVQRLRPCNDLDIATKIRIVKDSDTFSYFSGHAANSMAAMMFVFLLLRKHFNYSYLLFLYPLIFAYSRIYLGLHFPLDILSGYVFGSVVGVVFFCGI